MEPDLDDDCYVVMSQPRSVQYIGKADLVSLGHDQVKQALPIRHYDQVDPFLLIHHFDKTIEPGDAGLDVSPHPHRGFEPVTFLFDGAIHHRDSRGNEGFLKSGDVQWMTAGMGIVHSEAADKQWLETGGRINLIQLWVNLPAQHKMTQPNYQDIKSETIPVWEEEGFHVRVVAGEWNGLKGPATTHTPVNALEVRMQAGEKRSISLPETHQAVLYLMEGFLEFNAKHQAGSGFVAIFKQDGLTVDLEAKKDSHFLLLSGEPINEPVSSYGPFVMNTQTEIMEAVRDYQMGKMGMLTY